MSRFTLFFPFLCAALASPLSNANPQIDSASAHLQLVAMLNGEGMFFDPPGMPDPYAAMGLMFQRTLPVQALGWELAGFDPLTSKAPMQCVSSEEGFETESLGDAWRYHDERILSCLWGGQLVMSKVRITFEEENGNNVWLDTEIVEVMDSSEEAY